MLSGLRSFLFVLWLAVTVVPWALAVLLFSIFVRGRPVYWLCVGWLQMAIWGARFAQSTTIHYVSRCPTISQISSASSARAHFRKRDAR